VRAARAAVIQHGNNPAIPNARRFGAGKPHDDMTILVAAWQ